MIKSKIGLFSLIILLSLSGSSLFAEPSSSIVSKIIDGETLQLANGLEVKLIGVSTRSQSEKTSSDYSFGRSAYLAKKFMQAAVLGKTVILSYDKSFKKYKNKDRKGRTLAYVRYSAYFQDKNASVDGKTTFGTSSVKKQLNGEIIRQGYGFADLESSYQERKAFIRYEKEAREKRRGVWRPQTQFYDKMLERAKGARSGSVSKYIEKRTRKFSLESAEKTLTELTQLVPADYRAYYERSWLGADPLNDSVTEKNLEDIDKAIELSPSNPKCYAQKHFILRLLERHAEAVLAYEEAVRLASKYGMNASVTFFTEEEVESGQLRDLEGDKKMVGLASDGFRATLNKNHFLIFMARYKAFQGRNQKVEGFFNELLLNPVFKAYYDSSKEMISESKPHELIYETKWALEGWDDPEEALTKMEKASV